jgi:uncharacterized short protein YbdD (DUF466 family)
MNARSRIAAFFGRVAAALRRIVGAPDYEAYCAHMRRQHPTAAPLSRDDFEREQWQRRSSRPGNRCC